MAGAAERRRSGRVSVAGERARREGATARSAEAVTQRKRAVAFLGCDGRLIVVVTNGRGWGEVREGFKYWSRARAGRDARSHLFM